MKTLAAIKVKIGLSPGGGAKYPAFGMLPSVQATGLDWSKYVDVYGLGWFYDEIGHKDEAPDSPTGQQWGVLVVPPDFADEAVATFSDECVRLSEASCADFIENRALVRMPDLKHDANTLSGLQAEIGLLKELIVDDPTLGPRLDDAKARAAKAVNPDDPHPGVRRDPMRRWSTIKASHGVTFEEPA